MELNSILISISMLKEVLAGKTYAAVAAQYGVTRTAIERRVKGAVLRVYKEVGIEGLNEEGLGFVGRLRACGSAITAALERYEPRIPQNKRRDHVLTDEDIRLAVQKTRMRSPCAKRDVALLHVLLTTGARPLEIARLEVGDYLNADGSVREESVMRAEVATNRKARPLFFASSKVRESIDAYLTERAGQGFGTGKEAGFRHLDPHSRLFLTETGAPFEIVARHRHRRTRFLCRGIHDTYRRIFRRIDIPGLSALGVRHTVATRLVERGATGKQIGEMLGIEGKKALRNFVCKSDPPLQSIVRELI